MIVTSSDWSTVVSQTVESDAFNRADSDSISPATSTAVADMVIMMSRWNFRDFGHSLMMVFRIMCGEWVEPMWDCMNAFGYHCMPFFLLVLIVGNLLVSYTLAAFA